MIDEFAAMRAADEREAELRKPRPSTPGRFQPLMREIEAALPGLAAAEREAGDRWRRCQDLAAVTQGRLSGLGAEIRAITDAAARRLFDEGIEDIDAIRRLEELRRDLTLRLPIHVRAAELARQRFDAASRQLQDAHAQRTNILTAVAPRPIR